MARRNLKFGPIPFTSAEIHANVLPDLPGAYALGFMNGAKGMRVERIGRTDTCLVTRLHQYLNDPDYDACTHFFFEHSISVGRAYLTECELYHDYDPDLNMNHPGRPPGTTYCCPVCGCDD